MAANSIPSVLFIEPDESFMTVISYNLERCGFIVNSVRDSNLALHSAERVVPDLVILNEDITGSLSSGEICAVFKNKNSTKDVVVMLIAKNEESAQKFMKNHSNVSTFLVKPFATSELVAKVKSLLVKGKKTLDIKSQTLEYKNLRMNIGSYRVTRDGHAIHLGPTEFKILQCFMQLPSKVLSREEIIVHVWGYKSQIDPRTIDVHINRLRTVLNNDNDNALVGSGLNDNTPSIRTVRSLGYCLN